MRAIEGLYGLIEGLYGLVEGLCSGSFWVSALFAVEWMKNAQIIGLPRRKISKKQKNVSENPMRSGAYTALEGGRKGGGCSSLF